MAFKTFEPGEVFPNHIHEILTETFVGVEGRVELWIDRSECVDILPGVVRSVEAHREHCLRNATDEPAVICYIKSPHLPDDRVARTWEP
ncbi:MAG: cupin domain-containing protein [Leucobacter sp.]